MYAHLSLQSSFFIIAIGSKVFGECRTSTTGSVAETRNLFPERSSSCKYGINL
jgi:hypothetical protein